MITRRLFTKLLFVTPTITASGLTKAKNTPEIITTADTINNVLLNKCSIAGFQYYQGREVIASLVENDSLQLLAEPDNEFDKYAVEIFYKNIKLGYIPRSDNKPISRMLQAGIQLNCQVLVTDPNKQAWHAVIVAVYMLV